MPIGYILFSGVPAEVSGLLFRQIELWLTPSRDWKEHKLICGWRPLFNQAVDKSQDSKALAAELGITPFQMRQLAERMHKEETPRIAS